MYRRYQTDYRSDGASVIWLFGDAEEYKLTSLKKKFKKKIHGVGPSLNFLFIQRTFETDHRFVTKQIDDVLIYNYQLIFESHLPT